ncbi:MAG: uracil-DNA glycosylase family protein [Bacteroidota bacterium]
MKSTDFHAELDRMYSSLRILNVPLEKKCKHSTSCWRGIVDRMWNDDFEGQYDKNEEYEAHLSVPWIGESYDVSKLLVVGINLYDYGGYWAQRMFVEGAITQILDGRRRIKTGNPKYPGTFYWHRIPAYAVAILEKADLMKPIWEDDQFPSKEDTANAFEFIAMTNSIKCSPKTLPQIKNDRSKPTRDMWENCPRFILREEIEILKPEKILIFGNSDNLSYFNKKVLDSPWIWKNYPRTLKGTGKINGRDIEIFVVPHTSAFGGTSKEIMQSLIESLNDV